MGAGRKPSPRPRDWAEKSWPRRRRRWMRSLWRARAKYERSLRKAAENANSPSPRPSPLGRGPGRGGILCFESIIDTMKTPAAAIAWDIWARHRNRLAGMAITILAFALFYPKLCVWTGVDAHAANALDTIATTASERFKNASDLGRVIEI